MGHAEESSLVIVRAGVFHQVDGQFAGQVESRFLA